MNGFYAAANRKDKGCPELYLILYRLLRYLFICDEEVRFLS
jgi:hypothetical protein